MNSKYSYILCGVNITFAFVGAATHAFILFVWGGGFAVYNWYVAEAKRKMEEETNGKDNEESK